ncbi:HDOD domain-containing protein [bacterium]|nr:HDOD domain-containing protein [bacterium]
MTSKLEDLLLAKVDTLPQFRFSPILNEAMELLDDPDANVDALASVIAKDKQLAGQLMSTTTERAQRSVQNVHQAIRLMGLNTVKNFISATTEADGKTNGLDPATFEIMQGRLWKHSQLVAICCQLLAQELEYPNLSQAYAAGLFHDLGKAVLNAFAFEEISESIKLTQAKAVSTVTAEDHALGFNHSYFGAKVLERWGLPPALVEPVRLHHKPLEAQLNKRLVRIVHLADVAVNCQQTKLPIGISLFPVDKTVLAESGVTKERLAELAQQSADLFAKIEAKSAG